MGTGLLVAALLAGAMAVIVDPPSAGAGVRRRDQPGPRAPWPQQARAVRSTQGGRLDVLVALVLGAAYLASRPGSDIPAANGQGSAPRFAAIERFVRGEMAAQRIPGLALGISENDRVTYLRGFGKADDSGRPVTPTTPFIIGSIAKSFTALAIMQLVERGGKARRAGAALPALVPRRGQAASARITVRHLLNQTSGLSTKTGRTFQGSSDVSDAALEKTVRRLSSVELTAPVGKEHQYSTVNYSVLGLIVQTVAGRSYESYVQTEILDPFGCGVRSRPRLPRNDTGSPAATTTCSAGREQPTFRSTVGSCRPAI